MKLLLTKAAQTKIVSSLKLGMTYIDAARAAGVTYETFRLWRDRGEVEDAGLFHDFYVAVFAAQTSGLLSNLRVIKRHAKRDWRAAAYMIDRRDRFDATSKEKEEKNAIEQLLDKLKEDDTGGRTSDECDEL